MVQHGIIPIPQLLFEPQKRIAVAQARLYRCGSCVQRQLQWRYLRWWRLRGLRLLLQRDDRRRRRLSELSTAGLARRLRRRRLRCWCRRP